MAEKQISPQEFSEIMELGKKKKIGRNLKFAL